MTDRRNRLSLRLPILVGLLWGAVELNVAAQAPCIYDEARPVGTNLTRLVSTPANCSVSASSPTGEVKREGEYLVPAQPASAAPIWGVTKRGTTAYVLTRNPICKPVCPKPLVTEFTLNLTPPNTLI